jgi:hypothetical protein
MRLELCHSDAPEKVALADVTSVYTWNDRDIAFHRCKTCGCITHMEAIKAAPPVILSVNARMMVGLDPARVRLRQIDNGRTGFFWTKSDEPVIAGRHPPMPPPGPNDWREERSWTGWRMRQSDARRSPWLSTCQPVDTHAVHFLRVSPSRQSGRILNTACLSPSTIPVP